MDDNKFKFKRKNILLIPCYHSSTIYLASQNTFSFFVLQGFSCQPRNLVALCSSSSLAGDLQCCSLEMNTQCLWYSLSATLRPVFRHEIRRQMSVYLETQRTVTQSKTMAQFSFGFTDGSFLQLNGQKLLRSEDSISSKQEN